MREHISFEDTNKNDKIVEKGKARFLSLPNSIIHTKPWKQSLLSIGPFLSGTHYWDPFCPQNQNLQIEKRPEVKELNLFENLLEMYHPWPSMILVLMARLSILNSSTIVLPVMWFTVSCRPSTYFTLTVPSDHWEPGLTNTGGLLNRETVITVYYNIFKKSTPRVPKVYKCRS